MKKILLLLIIPFFSFGQTPITDDNIHEAVYDWLYYAPDAMSLLPNLNTLIMPYCSGFALYPFAALKGPQHLGW